MYKKKCLTCERIRWLKEQSKQHKTRKVMRNTLKITITEETRVDGIFSGRLNISGCRMVFCPECGRKLRKSETMYECGKIDEEYINEKTGQR